MCFYHLPPGVVTEPGLGHPAEETSGTRRPWKAGGLFHTPDSEELTLQRTESQAQH